VGVYYGTTGNKSDAELVAEGEGETALSHGEDVFPISASGKWESHWHESSIEHVTEVSVSISFHQVSDDGNGGDVVSMFAEFGLPSVGGIDEWTDGRWLWANGEVSSEPCGMPSAE